MKKKKEKAIDEYKKKLIDNAENSYMSLLGGTDKVAIKAEGE
jgi:hypothetical protein